MTEQPESARLLEVAHAAHRLGVSQDTIRRYVRDGKLPAIRLPGNHLRIEPADLSAFIEERRTANVGKSCTARREPEIACDTDA